MNMQRDQEELSCVVIPTTASQLLLPNVCVAEIVPWRRIKVLQKGPAWCMGLVGWRGQTLPVLNYAGFNGADGKPTNPRCLVIMNRSRSASGPAFYALAAEGLPRMAQIVEEDLNNESADLSPADVMKVRLGTDVVTIPDLGYVERNVADLMALGID